MKPNLFNDQKLVWGPNMSKPKSCCCFTTWYPYVLSGRMDQQYFRFPLYHLIRPLNLYLHIYPSIYLSTYPSIHLSIYLSIYPSIHLPIYLSIYTYKDKMAKYEYTTYTCVYIYVYIHAYMYININIQYYDMLLWVIRLHSSQKNTSRLRVEPRPGHGARHECHGAGVQLETASRRRETMRTMVQWIGLRENLQESPIFNGKIYGFL